MFDWQQHRTQLFNVLKAIYDHQQLAPYLGFKGGTAAMLFYQLPRMSVDLDFDLLVLDQAKPIYRHLSQVLSELGQIKDQAEKRWTLFWLLDYQAGAKNIKIEISQRKSPAEFNLKRSLGLSVQVMTKPDMFAAKLSALLTRPNFAARDVYDIWFFLKKGWMINSSLVKYYTGLNQNEAWHQALDKIETLPQTAFLQGLGELVDPDQKNWIRDHLQAEVKQYLLLRGQEV
jgi:predicted nucleotidyltransferase component of viral defense system